MRNEELWKPTKYVVRRGRLSASRSRRDVAVSSRLLTDLIAREYEREIPRHARGALLDLGCGSQPLYATYLDHVASIATADWPNSVHHTVSVDVYCDLDAPLPFADATFDTVLLSDVLEHLSQPQQALREVARVLRPGGVLLLNAPFMYWLHEEPYDFCRHTQFSLSRLSQEAGLEVGDLRPVGGVIDVLSDIVSKSVATVPFVGTPTAVLVQAAAAAIARTPMGRTLRLKSGTKFPLAYMLTASKPPRTAKGMPARSSTGSTERSDHSSQRA